MIVLTKNGAELNSPVGFDPVPGKDEAAPLEGAASGIEGNQPMKAFDAPIVQETQRQRKAFCTMQGLHFGVEAVFNGLMARLTALRVKEGVSHGL